MEIFDFKREEKNSAWEEVIQDGKRPVFYIHNGWNTEIKSKHHQEKK